MSQLVKKVQMETKSYNSLGGTKILHALIPQIDFYKGDFINDVTHKGDLRPITLSAWKLSSNWVRAMILGKRAI